MAESTLEKTSTADVAREAAAVVRAGFDAYHEGFLAISRRARSRFEAADWAGLQGDARERLDLYRVVLRRVLEEIETSLGTRAGGAPLWTAARSRYSESLAGHPGAEIAETFFNSVTRRVLGTVGVNPSVEFLDFQFARVPGPLAHPPVRVRSVAGGMPEAVLGLLREAGFGVPFEDAVEDATLVARRIEEQWVAGGAPAAIDGIELLDPVFFRRKGAYLIGRVVGGNRAMPLLLPIVHGPRGLRVDAVLLTEEDASIVFSFTRSYFHADVAYPTEVIAFLRALMPAKPVAELYAALGYHRHGKTEFYRDLQRHLARTDERFDIAPGAAGMVMVVFGMPGFDVVFKVIRDHFAPPKQTTPAGVRRRYEMVFAHDRAGRLVDAQEFEGLAFPTARFTRRLLDELTTTAGRTVRVEGDTVALTHLYTERRVRPLNLYLEDADPDHARLVALDYGQAIRDLAATNVFPGDLLLKNFGVTRHGRVVFYDYDELRLLSECRFRALPPPRYPEDEMSDEPWFHVGPEDVFPEDLGRFIPFAEPVRRAYLAAHGALYQPAFWQDLQARSAAGEVLDIYPYRAERRLRPDAG
jgi:isocitrate dehydrogenase kinase/phosphatase